MSPCAEHYFAEIVEIAKPRVIVAVGKRVVRYFYTLPYEDPNDGQMVLKFSNNYIPVVTMPHPADKNLTKPEKLNQLLESARKVKRLSIPNESIKHDRVISLLI